MRACACVRVCMHAHICVCCDAVRCGAMRCGGVRCVAVRRGAQQWPDVLSVTKFAEWTPERRNLMPRPGNIPTDPSRLVALPSRINPATYYNMLS